MKFMPSISKPTPSMAVALLALTVSLAGGTAYAANTIRSADIVDGQVMTADLANSAVTNPKLAANAVTGTKVAAGTLTGSDLVGDTITGAQVQESSLGQVPDSAKLGGAAPNAFARVFAEGTTSISGTLANPSDNFFLSGSAFTPPKDGRCVVTVEGQLDSSSTHPTDLGPFFRTAAAFGGGAAMNDGQYGHYFTPGVDDFSTDLTRSFVWSVTAGTPVQFGVYYGGPSSDWVGQAAETVLTYQCTTVTPGATGATAGTAHPAASAAGLAQDRALR